MFEWLKERMGKKEDLSDFKDHALGEGFKERPLWQREVERAPAEDSFSREFEQPQAMEERQEPFERPYGNSQLARRSDLAPALDTKLDDEPPSINPYAKATRFSPQSARGSNEELRRVEDGLIFIREQLSAIKAQNEMLNERLKNLERTLVPERF